VGLAIVFTWGALGLLIVVLARKLEESPRWYVNQNRLDEAEAAMERIERSARDELGSLPPAEQVKMDQPTAGGLITLRESRYVARTLMLASIWTFQTLGFYGFMAWAPSLLVAYGFSLAHSLTWSSVMQLGAVPGALLGTILSDRWERKCWLCVVAITVAVCSVLYGFAQQTHVIVLFGFLIAMLIQTFAPLLYAYTAECYPTRMRSLGAGLTYGTGRLANVVGPLMIGFLFNRWGYVTVFLYIAVCWILVAIIVGFMGPRTKGLILS
jgi:putative MFS transporter